MCTNELERGGIRKIPETPFKVIILVGIYVRKGRVLKKMASQHQETSLASSFFDISIVYCVDNKDNERATCG